MTIRLQMLGTGSAFSRKYSNNNALVYTEDYCLLIDCGMTALKALERLNKGIHDVNGILITHQHADHIGGLEEVAFKSKYILQKKINLFIPEALVHPLWEHSLKGGLENRHSGMTSLSDYFNVIPLKEKERTTISASLVVETIQTLHVKGKPNFSLFINDSIFYSGDVRFDRDLLEFVAQSRGCRVILHDCSFALEETIHATLNQLLTLPVEIQQRMMLMHYEDNMQDFIGCTGQMCFIRENEIYHL